MLIVESLPDKCGRSLIIMNCLTVTLAALVWILEADTVSNVEVNGTKIIALKNHTFATVKAFPI